MAESINHSATPDSGESADTLPIPQQDNPDLSLRSPTKGEVVAATGLTALAGLAATASRVEAASPTPTSPAHIQSVGNQEVSTAEFLKTAKVSASELLKLRPNQVKTAEKSKNPAADFTAKLFEQISNNTASSYEGVAGKGNPPLMAFNGIATVNGDAKWYSYIDPTLGKGYKKPEVGFQIGYGLYGKKNWLYKAFMAAHGLNQWGPGKKIQMKSPVFKWDGQRWWLGVSNLTAPNYKNRGELDGNDINQPSDQATESDEWNWTVYDPSTVSLFEYTDGAMTPKIQPFFPLYAVILGPNIDPTNITDQGILNDFKPANGWVRPPSMIAGWQDLHYDGSKMNKGYGDYPSTDGGKFISPAQSKQELSRMHLRAYKLSSNPRSVVRTMVKCAGYTGND